MAKRPVPLAAWMPEAQYEQIPETLTLRELRFDVIVPGAGPKQSPW